jgi:hypothetical protein
LTQHKQDIPISSWHFERHHNSVSGSESHLLAAARGDPYFECGYFRTGKQNRERNPLSTQPTTCRDSSQEPCEAQLAKSAVSRNLIETRVVLQVVRRVSQWAYCRLLDRFQIQTRHSSTMKQQLTNPSKVVKLVPEHKPHLLA